MTGRWRDHFTDKAQKLGFEARSVFKLEEIQRRTRIIHRGARVVDLGCYPGSWSRYLLGQGVSKLVGIDLKAPTDLPGGIFLVSDVFEVAPEAIREALGGPADLVVSDMAPSTTGSRLTDNVRQVALARRALDLARALLVPGGGFVTKVFEGVDAPALVDDVRRAFADLRRLKPEATRRQSVEFFVVATGFLGKPE